MYAYYNKGNIYFHLDELDEAMKNYDKAILRFEGYYDAYFKKGDVLKAKEKYNQAIAQYE